jgi:hypothetical protein
MTLGGGAISSWRDIKFGHDAIQPTGTSQPVYSATSFGGDPGVAFDGVDDFMHLTPHPFPVGAAPSEIWALVSQAASIVDGVSRYAVAYGGSSTTQRSINRAIGGGINLSRSTVGAASSTLSGVDFSSRHVARAQVTGADVVHWLDGVAAASATVVPATIDTRMRIGAFINSSPGSFWHGQIAAILITNPLSTEKATALQTYLMNRRKL